MNTLIMEENEREKARQLLKDSNKQQRSNKSVSNFDWSDLKIDKTQFLDKTPNISSFQKQNSSPFEHKEISARSTAIKFGSKKDDCDFDTLMKSSLSSAVQNRYRESVANGRLSVMSSNKSEDKKKMDIWSNQSQLSFSLNSGPKNLTFSNENFFPAEEMADQLDEDERMHEMEYAIIPRIEGRETYTKANTSNWEENVSKVRQPEMSFGQYCDKNVNLYNIRDIYSKKSPPKRHDRVPLVELSKNEMETDVKDLSSSSAVDSIKIEDLIRKGVDEEKIFKKIGKSTSSHPQKIRNSHNFSSSISEMIDNLNFDKIIEKTKIENRRNNLENEEKSNKCERINDDLKEEIPVQDECDNTLKPSNTNQVRGIKRRPPSACSDTPLSTLDKCHRSKSPVIRKELELAAAKLKPQIIPDENIFKIPRSYDSTIKGTSSTTLNREYLTAMESLSIRSHGEKLSLPNYGLTRPMYKSPTSSNHSKLHQWSPNGSEGQLKRSVSQLSTGSEFHDDFLPIKIDNSDNRKLSFPTVKVDKSVEKTFAIQNGSDRKLPLRVRIVGAGFSVTPKEDFRMVKLEARTFCVKFTPSVVGPAYGRLVFELSTNRLCTKTIPLYGYGGHSNVQINGVQKGPFGPSFITMGTIRDLSMVIEKTIRLSNSGTLPSFASLVFEKTKLSDFTMSESISIDPMQMKIDPGKSVNVKIRFKATRSDFRKIVAANKEVTTIGEIFVICGDEPTRLRILMNKNKVDQKLLTCLPKNLPNEIDIQSKLEKFREDLSRDKLSMIMNQIRTHEIAITINKNLDDTQILPTEISMIDDTQINFETFIDTNYTRFALQDEGLAVTEEEEEEKGENVEILESKYFKITPSKIVFDRSIDLPEMSKVLKIESLSNIDLYFEVVSSYPKLISVGRSSGKLSQGEVSIMNVKASLNCFQMLNHNRDLFLTVLIKDARIEIPIEFI